MIGMGDLAMSVWCETQADSLDLMEQNKNDDVVSMEMHHERVFPHTGEALRLSVD